MSNKIISASNRIQLSETEKNTLHFPQLNQKTPWFILAIFITTVAFLGWNTIHRVNISKENQHHIIKASIGRVANDISSLMEDRRKGIRLITEREFRLIRHLFEHPEDTGNFSIFREMIIDSFPGAINTAITDVNKTHYFGSSKKLIKDNFDIDTNYYSQNRIYPSIEIRWDGDKTYFDIMSVADLRLPQDAIVVVSFTPDILVRLLGNGQIQGHNLLLVNRRNLYSIEITATGVLVGNIEKDAYMKNNLEGESLYRLPIEGTSWDLVDILDQKSISQIGIILIETSAVFSILLLISLIVGIRLYRLEKKMLLQKITLDMQTQEIVASKALVQCEQHEVNDLLERMTDAFILVDYHWVVRKLNSRFETLFKLNRADAVGTNLWELLPKIASYFTEQFNIDKNDQRVTEFEAYFSPTNQWFEVRAYPSENEIAIFLRDITIRANREESLRNSEKKIRAVFDTTIDAIVTISQKGDIVSVNKAVETIFGYTSEELVDKNVSCLMPDAIADKHDSYLEKNARSRKNRWFGTIRELQGKKCNGELFPIEISLGEFIIDHHVFYTGIIRDISARKITEEKTKEAFAARISAEQANEAKSLFLANMSHEIRTPLTAIIGFSETLLDTDQGMEQRLRMIKTIIRGGKHLLQIINDILDLSKIEANKREIVKAEVKLETVLTDVNTLIGLLAKEKGLEFSISIEGKVPSVFFSDEIGIKQIIINLSGNAVKFTRRGTVAIKISFNLDKEELLFRVIDTGIGMTKQQMDVIFEPFLQADSSTTKCYGGTGLGLTISHELVIMLGGKLVVNSELGKGSQFEFTLPIEGWDSSRLIDCYTTAEIKNSQMIPYSPTSKVSGNILIAEDNVDLQDLIKIYIAKTGADFTIVENGALVIEELARRYFDLILLDIQMPVMDGMATIRHLKANGHKVPIVAITANTSVVDVESYLAVGFEDVISKPIDRNNLFDMVCKFLKPADEHKEATPIISELIDEKPDFLELVKKYVRSLPGTLQKIGEASKRSDYKEIRKHLHDLKGTGSAFGYTIITELAAKTHFQIVNENYLEVTQLLADLEFTVERIVNGMDFDKSKKEEYVE